MFSARVAEIFLFQEAVFMKIVYGLSSGMVLQRDTELCRVGFAADASAYRCPTGRCGRMPRAMGIAFSG